MAIFITIMGTHGHFRYTLVRAYVCIFLSSTELTDDEKLQNTIRKHLKLLYNSHLVYLKLPRSFLGAIVHYVSY